MTLIERIRVARGRGENCVRLQFAYDFDIQVDRLIAERLRDDITHWLNRFPADDAAQARVKGKEPKKRKGRAG